MSLLALLCAVAVVAAGCGSSKKHAATLPLPTNVLPQAKTPDEWATRIVNRFLRPLNKDLSVLNGFNSPDIRLFIASQNPTTLKIIDQRLQDLKQCSAKLVAIGPPPAGNKQLARINADFTSACAKYVQVAETLMKATDFLSSGRTDVMSKGEELARSMRPTSGLAANKLVAGVRIAQKLPEFQRAGLKPSV
jgi:hypothetical protein